MNFVMMSQHHVASNHQQLACLLNSLFRLTAPSKHHLCITGPLLEECLHWLVDPLHKGQYSVSPIYRGRVYRGIGYIAVPCWTPFFWRPRARYFSRNRGNTLDPIRKRQFFAKSAHRDSLCSRFAGDNFSRNQLWPTCQQVEAGPIFSGHWIPYLFFRTSPDIIGYSRCPDFSGHVRRPTQLPKLTRLLTSAISVAI